MSWPLRALIGPTLWAIGFSLTYALHGVGCARDWSVLPAPVGNLHEFTLILAFLLTLAATMAALLAVPRGTSPVARTAISAGGWIGLAATALTLFPVLGLTSCG